MKFFNFFFNIYTIAQHIFSVIESRKKVERWCKANEGVIPEIPSSQIILSSTQSTQGTQFDFDFDLRTNVGNTLSFLNMSEDLIQLTSVPGNTGEEHQNMDFEEPVSNASNHETSEDDETETIRGKGRRRLFSCSSSSSESPLQSPLRLSLPVNTEEEPQNTSIQPVIQPVSNSSDNEISEDDDTESLHAIVKAHRKLPSTYESPLQSPLSQPKAKSSVADRKLSQVIAEFVKPLVPDVNNTNEDEPDVVEAVESIPHVEVNNTQNVDTQDSVYSVANAPESIIEIVDVNNEAEQFLEFEMPESSWPKQSNVIPKASTIENETPVSIPPFNVHNFDRTDRLITSTQVSISTTLNFTIF